MTPLIVGHRGSPALAPENTLASFGRALEDGAECVEFDVRFSREGEPVVIHDPTVDRTTDGTGPVRAKSLDELRRLDAGGWFAPAFRGERVPALAEVLDRLRGRAGANIEVKDAGEDLVAGVGRILADVRSAGTALWLLSSFQLAIVAEAVRQGAPAGLLLRRGATHPTARAVRLGAGAVVFSITQASQRRIEAARRRSLAAWVYTVNDPERFQRFARWGATALIGDRPDLLRAWRERL